MLVYEVGRTWKVNEFSNINLKINLTAFCDSNYAGDKETRKSVTAYAIYFEKCLIAFKSRSEKYNLYRLRKQNSMQLAKFALR